ncbi:hypothetical protein SDC9_54844 [bioreactor metagenome]|uniref:Uncharacterized protein n=1 Tax=bioreactor metagenome TaxID=1076179 RepID=A0A644WY41_9ZZZZ
MGVKIHFIRKTHLSEELGCRNVDVLMDGIIPVFRLFPGQELACQHDVFQRGILGEEIEGLKHQTEMEPLFPNLPFLLRSGISRVEEQLAGDGNPSAVGGFQKV